MFNMQLRQVVESKSFPHFLATLLWTLPVTSLVSNMRFSVAITGAVANGGLKVIMPFHLLMLFLPVACCLIFCTIRHEGITEKCIIGLSAMTILFSTANILLHFVNGLVLPMKTTEVISWSLYNTASSISLYKVSVLYVPPALKRYAGIQKEKPLNSSKPWVGDRKRKRHR